MRMSADQFQSAVQEALAEVPDSFRPYLANVIVDVEPMPDAALLREMEIDDPTELLGVYAGTPLTERSVDAPAALPDRVVLFQRNLERACRNRRELVLEIRLTVLHELGHHFGLDEEELDELGYG